MSRTKTQSNRTAVRVDGYWNEKGEKAPQRMHLDGLVYDLRVISSQQYHNDAEYTFGEQFTVSVSYKGFRLSNGMIQLYYDAVSEMWFVPELEPFLI